MENQQRPMIDDEQRQLMAEAAVVCFDSGRYARTDFRPVAARTRRIEENVLHGSTTQICGTTSRPV